MKLFRSVIGSLVFFGAQTVAQDSDVRPSPPSIGSDVPVTYFGPPPSSVQKELIGKYFPQYARTQSRRSWPLVVSPFKSVLQLTGPHQLLTAGLLDADAGTIRLPLYAGRVVLNRNRIPRRFNTTSTIWYVVTDTTDKGNAEGLGLNYSPKLRFANTGRVARWAEMGSANVVNFDQSSFVDFSPVRNVVPGDSPNYFPPKTAQPGAVGNINVSISKRLQKHVHLVLRSQCGAYHSTRLFSTSVTSMKYSTVPSSHPRTPPRTISTNIATACQLMRPDSPQRA